MAVGRALRRRRRKRPCGAAFLGLPLPLAKGPDWPPWGPGAPSAAPSLTPAGRVPGTAGGRLIRPVCFRCSPPPVVPGRRPPGGPPGCAAMPPWGPRGPFGGASHTGFAALAPAPLPGRGSGRPPVSRAGPVRAPNTGAAGPPPAPMGVSAVAKIPRNLAARPQCSTVPGRPGPCLFSAWLFLFLWARSSKAPRCGGLRPHRLKPVGA